jgi:hypothetical protein
VRAVDPTGQRRASALLAVFHRFCTAEAGVRSVSVSVLVLEVLASAPSLQTLQAAGVYLHPRAGSIYHH